MADKKTTAKRSQTVRERSQNDNAGAKKHRVRKTASTAAKPAKAAHKGLKTAAKPFKPLAKPFKTKPARKAGRILSTVLLITYLRGSWHELRQVTWPDRKTTAKLTLAVFVFAVVFGSVIALTDFLLDKVFRKILLS